MRLKQSAFDPSARLPAKKLPSLSSFTTWGSDFLHRGVIVSPLDQADGMRAIRLVDVRLAAGNRFMVPRPQAPPPLTFASLEGAAGLPVNLKIHFSLLAMADNRRSVPCETRVDEDVLRWGVSVSGDITKENLECSGRQMDSGLSKQTDSGK